MTTKIDPLWLPTGKHWDLQIVLKPSKRHHGGLDMDNNGLGNSVVLHAFESAKSLAAMAMHEYLEGSGDVVHITANLTAGTVVQALPLNRGAYGLKHSSGISPNTSGNKRVQIELAGTANGFSRLTNTEEKHLAALLELVNHRTKCGRSVPRDFRGAASTRFSDTAWKNVKGIVGHCHAPQNDHYDPGSPDMKAIVGYMREF